MVTYSKIIKKLSADVPFVGPEAQERLLGSVFKVRLGANESVFGPSEKAIIAMQNCISKDVWKYGDPENYDLRNEIAKRMNVGHYNVIIGEGIDGLLGYLIRLIIEPGTKVISSLGAYPTFNYHVRGSGGELIFVPYYKDHEDLDSLIKAASKSGAKLIYFANPDNPMGTVHLAKKIEEIINKIPDDCLLCIDEAYTDFAPEEFIPNIDIENNKVIRFRTFSKAYGLAGARIGYAVGSQELIRNFDKVRNHFGVNRIAQIGALAALEDKNHLIKVQKNVQLAKKQIEIIAKENSLSTIKSFTNFVAIDCGKTGDYAYKVMQKLIEYGVFVRMPSVAPLNRCIRLTVGKNLDLNYFAEQLPKALKQAL